MAPYYLFWDYLRVYQYKTKTRHWLWRAGVALGDGGGVDEPGRVGLVHQERVQGTVVARRHDARVPRLRGVVAPGAPDPPAP